MENVYIILWQIYSRQCVLTIIRISWSL